jgi:hypothetical protein
MLDSLKEDRVYTLIRILGKPSAKRVYEATPYSEHKEEYNWPVIVKSQNRGNRGQNVRASILYNTEYEKPIVEVLERGTQEAYFLSFSQLRRYVIL